MINVLLVEDDTDIRQVVAFALSDEGYHVDEVGDGRAALESIERKHPDIILLDMKMPRMDGWQFAKAYRERYDHQAPIIVLTAAQDAAIRAASIDAQGYLAKPFNIDDLLRRITAVREKTGADPRPNETGGQGGHMGAGFEPAE